MRKAQKTNHSTSLLNRLRRFLALASQETASSQPQTDNQTTARKCINQIHLCKRSALRDVKIHTKINKISLARTMTLKVRFANCITTPEERARILSELRVCTFNHLEQEDQIKEQLEELIKAGQVEKGSSP